MPEGPNIAQIGALLGDPARANMLSALMSGQALTARELADVAGVTPQTASGHLGKMLEGGLLAVIQQGRHRYYTFATDQVAEIIEQISMLAADRGHLRFNTGPRDPAMRHARLCYRHLAGARGVQMLDSLAMRNMIELTDEAARLTESGLSFLSNLGVELPVQRAESRVLCKTCLDWSARRFHLGGIAGRALWRFLESNHWARREKDSRVVLFTSKGVAEFDQAFPLVD